MRHWSDLVDILHNVCANCYKRIEKAEKVNVASIDGFRFCSKACALEAMKRKGAY